MRARVLLVLGFLAAGVAWLLVRPSAEEPAARQRPAGPGPSAAAVPMPVAAVAPIGSSVLAGHVTRDGAPSAATVEVRARQDALAGPVAPLVTAIAGSDGAYVAPGLGPGRYEVLATAVAGGSGTRWVDIPVDGIRLGLDVRIRSDAGLSLRGRATWEDGRPFTGLVRGPPDAPCGADGRFTLEGLAPGWTRLAAVLPGRARFMSPEVRLPREEELLFVVDAGTRVLAGQVVAVPDLAPVPGARVTAHSDGPEGAGLMSAAETDAAGRFQVFVRAGRTTLEVEAAGFRPERKSVPAGTPEMQVILYRGARLSGTMVSADDRTPVAGVTVGLSLALETFDAVQSGPSDEQGHFEFPAAPCGDVELDARSADWVTVEEGKNAPHGKARVSVAPGGTQAIELRVRRAARIAGRVVDERGAGIAGVLVRARQGEREAAAATDPGGAFLVGGLRPGERTVVSAECMGRAAAKTPPLWPAAGEPLSVELCLPAPRWLQLTVLDAATGGPVSGAVACVERRSADGRELEPAGGDGETRADGTARLGPLPAGPLLVRVRHEEYLELHQPVPEADAARPGGPPAMAVSLDPALAISGRVLLPDGSPAPRGRGRLRLRGMDWKEWEFNEGRFRVRGLAPGVYLLRAGIGGEPPLRGGAEALAGDNDVVITLALEEPWRDSCGPPVETLVRLLDPAGRPVLWAEVDYAWPENCIHASLDFEPPGLVRLQTILNDGRRILVRKARSADGEPLGCVITEYVSPDRGPREIRLPAELAIEGVALAPGGRPAAGLLLTASPYRGPEEDPPPWYREPVDLVSEARTDSGGRFRLGGLGPGTYAISLSGEGAALSMTPVRAEAGATGVLIEAPESASARIMLLDWQGAPAPGVAVEASRDGPYPPAVVTGSDGVAVLTGLDLGGIYTLRIEDKPNGAEPGVLRTDWRPRDETIRLDRLFRISGVVRDERGRPVAGASVYVDLKGHGYVPSVRTLGDGSFTIDGLPEDTGTLSVSIGSAESEAIALPKLEVAAGTEDLVLTVRRPRILNVRVEHWPGGRGHLLLSDRGTGREEDGEIEADGTVRFTGLDPAAVYSLWLEWARGRCAYRPEVRGDAGEVTLQLEPTKSITGRLLLPEGSPAGVAGGTVSAEGPGLRVGGIVRPDLTYEVSGLPDGEWTLNARMGEFHGTARARAGETADITLGKEGD